MTTLYPRECVTPDAIHAAAALNHLTTAPPAGARVLELGCGAATRLVMHARAYPGSITIGIDIDESEVAKGQQLAVALECNNIELFVAGLGDLLAVDPGEFDYIIIHQAFTFIGMPERKALLQWCQAHLAENGVVAIRWSVLPDSTPQKTLSEALRFHLARAAEGDDLLQNVRAMLSYLLVTLEEGALKQEVLAADSMNDATLIETYLAQDESGVTLMQFSRQAETAGLHYLGDILPQYETGEYYNPLIAQMLNVVSAGAEWVIRQQYLDYAVQRAERFSLLCHRAAGISAAEPDFDCLRSLHWAGSFTRCHDDNNNVCNSFINSQGKVINTDNGILINLLELLGNAWPMSLSFEQLVFNCQAPENNEDVRDSVLDALKALFMRKDPGLYWSGSPCIYNQATNDLLAPAIVLPSLRPEQPLAVENLWGESVLLTPAGWDYLQGDMSAVDTAAWACYSDLKIKGLLIGSTSAWKQQLQRFLRNGQIDVLKSQLSLLLLLSVNQEQGGLLQAREAEPEAALPDLNADAIYAHLNTLISAGHFEEGREYAHGLLQHDPENIHILRCYSRACVLTSAWDDALLSLCKLMGYYFSDKNIYYDLALVLQKKREFYYAQIIMRTLIKFDNKNLGYWQNLASLHFVYGDLMLAERCCRAMLRLNPQQGNYFDMFGIIFSSINRMDEARYFMEKAVELSQHNLTFLSNLLFVMSHDATVPPEELLAKHLEYGRSAQAWAAGCEFPTQRHNIKDPVRKLRLGFVSGDLRNHPVTNFLLPFWDGLDRERYELVAYNTIVSRPDTVSEHLKNTAVLWRQVDAISDLELARMIVEDGVDILFDLAGHTAYNRLPVFALRPAPVQISWIGYPGTTGLAEMDYRILTATLARTEGLKKQFAEELMFIETRKLFEPHPASPLVNELPALRNGYITFGSFNRRNKINDSVLESWARILLQYPQSKLMLGHMTEDDAIISITKVMEKLGVCTERLTFLRRTGIEQYLAYHHEVDILLDAFPYSGGTTTNHGAWMGVPTLTMGGLTPASQQGVDIMRTYGLDEFIASDKEDYICRALSWRDRLDELNSIRLGMRSHIPTENEENFDVAATFDRALREAWGLYCRGEAPRTMLVEEKSISFI